MDRSALSPDLTPSKHRWDILGQPARDNNPPAGDVNHVLSAAGAAGDPLAKYHEVYFIPEEMVPGLFQCS